jgi:hypothetical protein
MSPRSKPPRCACHAIPRPIKESRRKIAIATQSGTGTGIGIIKTLNLGAIIANAPPRAKMAPEAPIPIEREGARKIKKRFPIMPPRKYTTRNFFSPISLIKKLPRKYRLTILHMIWPKPPWTKRLVIIVQGRWRKIAGIRPKREYTASQSIKVTIKTKTFITIKNQSVFKL